MDSSVTQIEFSPYRPKLNTAMQRNKEFLCWDLRNPGVVLFSLQGHLANTKHRIQFALSRWQRNRLRWRGWIYKNVETAGKEEISRNRIHQSLFFLGITNLPKRGTSERPAETLRA